ncbi:phosphatidylinositol 4-kinase-like protein [Thermochaetoides thermophila DSM 1495]|uniref:Phosphatidylinositol 4-kinase n=1 Tax=Chaetomium thermophilum (strain DSM 1495 / CBS 144.50 / IMI 039719) TaxID=759272 RepID=G0S858_CHATD|nr:phosphatidylinositol 4-kinase-like protein [Thermochaetoides thermophila DSM 1495]EGS21105.1 phosphatidylinositol 4-kinase-like protein [Thermochaetoides thermophila DSM 1495]
MPRPATTGYERLAQADHSDESDDDPLMASYASLQPASTIRYAPIGQPRPHSGMTTPKRRSSIIGSSSAAPGGSRSRRRGRRNSGVDLKAINARLERWADEIASKFKRTRKKKEGEDERLEIHHSVFVPPEGIRPVTAEQLNNPEPGYMSKEEFEEIVESVRTAIRQGVHPRMISQGSSGSYFARNPEGKVVGVFKPKDEEPYAVGNPKWTKWIHRNLFPCFFGRACLIPNLSYVSEAAAYVLDVQLRTHLVPYTDVVYLSSKSFHYPFWDRYNHSRKGKPLPAKPGSFQVFLKGYKDANLFLREHPWPDQYIAGFRTTDPHRKRRRRWADSCRPMGAAPPDDDGDSDEDAAHESPRSQTLSPENFVWTPTLKQAFREELEKLVILDYIMRNTDRGLDNWMIKVDWETQSVSIRSEPIHLNMDVSDRDPADEQSDPGPRPVDLSKRPPPKTRVSYPYRPERPMDPSTPPPSGPHEPKITIGAIDNSLSWPWKHPDAWRSFPFGWLFLPVDLIGRPFSQKTRDHFLPLLTSTAWWSQTQARLRKVFQVDPDFQERMFAKQMAVMKGQAWNVVETLKTADHGPLELTRRPKVCVWDDLVDVPVAVPMRVASVEMRRRAERLNRNPGAGYIAEEEEEEEEEMDIAALHGQDQQSASAPAGTPTGDLLGMASPSAASMPTSTSELPHPGRFELALADEPVSPALVNGSAAASSSTPYPEGHSSLSSRQAALNMYAPGRTPGNGSAEPQRIWSYTTTAAARRESNSIAAQLYHGHSRHGSSSSSRGAAARRWSEDENWDRGVGGGGDRDEEDEFEIEGGDLGYAAATGMEANRRKVIVERLEMVKARNPVFTWC